MTNTPLRIAPNFFLPLDALTETLAILGIRGSGKTNTATVFAEELLRLGQQVVIIDPVDSWWGLKSSKDGTEAGYPVVVLGGRHADLPLGEKDGKTLADFVSETRTSVVLSLRHFESKGQQQRFIVDFARRLYHLKGQTDNPTPLMLIIDEASLVVPQRVMGDEAQMVGAIQKLVRQGRTSGIGVTLIDQRAATVNKDVLTQLELLICHRTTSPQDRKALREWVSAHDPEGKIDNAFLSDLSSLPQGTAWFWSSGWLDVFRSVKVRERETFDSSRTPKAGERFAAPAATATVDLDALKAKLTQSIEKAKADDPAVLRARIRELEKAGNVGAVDVGAVHRAVADERQRWMEHVAFIESKIQEHIVKLRQIRVDVGELESLGLQWDSLPDLDLPPVSDIAVRHVAKPFGVSPMAVVSPLIREKAERTAAVVGVGSRSGGGEAAFNTEFKLRKGERKMLNALAQRHPIGATEGDIALLAGLTRSGGTFSTYMGVLKKHGLIQETSSGFMITQKGRESIDAYPAPAPQTNAEIWNMWMGAMRAGERRMMEVLLEAYPARMSRETLAERSGITESGGTFTTYIGTLKRSGVVIEDGEDSGVVLNSTLFPEGAP